MLLYKKKNDGGNSIGTYFLLLKISNILLQLEKKKLISERAT